MVAHHWATVMIFTTRERTNHFDGGILFVRLSPEPNLRPSRDG
jgi:hypothetical protein